VEVSRKRLSTSYTEVTFVVSVDGGDYQPVGVDDNAPFRVYYDVSGLPGGTSVTFKAIAADLAGNLSSAKVTVPR
jgi:alpha-amylase